MADDIHVRLCLQDIVKLDLEVKAVIQDIKQDAETTEMLDDYNTEGRRKISELRKRIADLERLGLEQEKEADRSAIEVNVKSLRQKLSSTTGSLRQATLSTKLTLDKKMKDELLSGSSQVRQRNQGNRESLAKSANNISQNLVSLNRTLEEQVKQSEMNATTIHLSSNTIKSTHDEFHSMGGHIQHSRRLLTKYGRREFTDRLLILLALVFFFATVLYIMKKRLWPS